MTPQIEIEFDKTMVIGNRTGALKESGAGKRDLFMIAIESIKVMEGFNVRVDNDEHKAHVRLLADSMKREGYFPEKALAGIVLAEDGKDVIYVTDGHCRLEAAKLAMSEGAELGRLPMIFCAAGTSREDVTVALVKSNTGKELSPYEIGLVCKRLSRFGWDSKEIATRLNMGEARIEDLLMLVAAPIEIREMVINGQVSASMAITALKADPENAAENLAKGLSRAQNVGAKRVTAKHMVGSVYKKAVKKAAPEMLSVLNSVKSDPAFASMDETLRVKIEAIMQAMLKAQTKDEEKSIAAAEVGDVLTDETIESASGEITVSDDDETAHVGVVATKEVNTTGFSAV